MVFFIVACVNRLSTRTTTVLFCLSLTTTPWSVRFGISNLLFLRLRLGARFWLGGGLRLGGFRLFGGRRFSLWRRLRGASTLLRGDRLHARDVAPDGAHARSILQLPGGALKAQVELLLLQLDHFVIKLIECHCSGIGGFHDPH